MKNLSFLKISTLKGLYTVAFSRNSKYNFVPQTCLAVFLKLCWGIAQLCNMNVCIFIWPRDLNFKNVSNHDFFYFKVKGFSWVPLVQYATRWNLRLFTELQFILFILGIMQNTFQVVTAEVADSCCNHIKGITMLRKHHFF